MAPRNARLSLVGGDQRSMLLSLLKWLELQSAAAGGASILALAHNGVNHDWPLLTAALARKGLRMPPCVVGLGCSQALFVAGIEEKLHGFWSMQRVYKARFGYPDFPNSHTAAGDVLCVRCLLTPRPRRHARTPHCLIASCCFVAGRWCALRSTWWRAWVETLWRKLC